MEHETGPLLVLAGAGSGKTRVITARVARLLACGVAPSSILAVTFTNKAAREMRERIGAAVGRDAAAQLWVSTFHSFGARFVRAEASALGMGSRFQIFDQGDSLGVIRELLRTHGGASRRLDAYALLTRISLWKSALVEPARARPKQDEYDQEAASLYPFYEASLSEMHALDFDDLVVKPVRLLCDRPRIRAKWRGRFEHLLVDEFQDTNLAQLELVRLLANERMNVCVVGDDDQSIYGWRGACVQNILDFETHFPGATIVKLEQNYRSRPAILNVANAAIEQAKARPFAKRLEPVHGAGSPVRLCVLPEPPDEAKLVASEIRNLERQGTDLREIAVLYRSNTQAKLFEEELRIAGIGYRLFGGTKLYDRKEIKDGIAFLRLALDPHDELSFRRIANVPPRGLGAQSLRHLIEHASTRRTSLVRALARAEDVEGLSPRARASAARLGNAIETASMGFHAGRLADTAQALMRAVGFLDESDDPQEHRRNANVWFLLRSIERLERQGTGGRDGLQTLLHRLALDSTDADEPEPGRVVTLSSLHSAKGLEFSVVFLTGCVEGILPHARSTDPRITDLSSADIEEERRLFYVGVTRARELLYLTRYRERVHRGRIVKVAPSRFLEGLPETELEDYKAGDDRELDRDEVAEMTRALLERLRGSSA